MDYLLTEIIVGNTQHQLSETNLEHQLPFNHGPSLHMNMNPLKTVI